MPLQKVYVSADINEALYCARADYSDENISLVYYPDNDTFKSCHMPTLVGNKNIQIFVGVDDVDKDILLQSYKLVKNTVWIFKSLPKNSKVYKDLLNKVSIDFVEPLTNLKSKKSFIREMCKAKGLPTSYVEDCSRLLGERRAQIDSELDKFKIACGVLDNPLYVLSDNEQNNDIFELLDAVISQDLTRSLYLYNKIQLSLEPVQFAFILLKQLNCYIHLSLGETEQALSQWRIPNWLLKEKTQKAKSITCNKLYKLYGIVWDTLLDFTSNIPPEFKIRRVIWQACRL